MQVRLKMAMNLFHLLRVRLKVALQSYLNQKSSTANSPDEALLDTAFTALYNRREEVKDLSELTMAEYIQLFFGESCWGRCKDVVTVDEQELRHMLEGVRDTRNMLAHFREYQITPQRRQQLKVCADWLSERERLMTSALSRAAESSCPAAASG